MRKARRIFPLVGLIGISAVVWQSSDGAELIRDPRFRRGLAVLHIDPPAGPRNGNDPFNGDWVGGLLQPASSSEVPIWRAGQWYSRFDLASAHQKTDSSGEIVFFDGAKTVAFGPLGSDSADLKLRLNGRTEWNDTSPITVGAWPHLLVQQQIERAPRIADLAALRLKVEYRLNRLDVYRDANWNETRQTAKFGIFLTLRNEDPSSAEFGDYLWFGIPLFDSRYDVPHRYVAQDRGNSKKRGTNKFIFTAGGVPFGVRKYEVGRWDSIDCDLAPFIKTALRTAWEAGYLTDRKELHYYSIGAINFGWETSGPVDAEMQVRGLSLNAEVSSDSL